ncbi:MAG: T9SS type A sorting domain-containing protein [Prolixibacteraceae bacterium]|nr:T9SS type A sorting domain-containing protein [Prolixibacteraceae bacterium]
MLQKISYLFFLLLLLCFNINATKAQDVTITVNANQDKKAVSPYIYGLNNSFDKPAQFYSDAGVHFSRMNGGNNATKYNWRKKISSHPDWYNNVYGNDWDKNAMNISSNHPDMQGMFAFQLLGRVASSNAYNFNDWAFNQSQYWEGHGQNLAGGGTPNTTGVTPGKAAVEGDIELYTEEWPADSTVGILKHWFGTEGLGLNKEQFLYWSMDNEADVWDGTHDDVMKDGLLPASEFMDNYIEVAKKARALFPDIKICGPVTTSEWQWYKWGKESIRVDGKYYTWFEYFIKRCADEEKASGIRVLDVFDIHHYPYAPADADALQNHRIFYDKDYNYPGANGLYTIDGGWNTASKKEYIFTRIEDWLDKHYGKGHGITLALSEWSPGPNEPNLASVIYSTHLGLFANHGVEFFSPWSWFTGMWESLHLFSRYAKGFSVSSISSLENTVSAYTTVNENSDSTTIIIVNRDQSAARNVTVNLNGLSAVDGSYKTLQLSSLPASETFKSHTNNALKESSVAVSSNSFTINVPKLSTTAVLLVSTPTTSVDIHKNRADDISIYPNPVENELYINMGSSLAEPTQITVFDQQGRKIKVIDTQFDGSSDIKVDLTSLHQGYYFLTVRNNKNITTKSFVVKR